MKKATKIIISAFLFFSFIVPINADQSSSLFAYTSSTVGFDEYAEQKLSEHIFTYYGYVNDDLELGKGITVYGDVAYPMVLYPIWLNQDIVATFRVINVNGMFSGSYSEGNVEQLNYMKAISSVNKPITLHKTEKDFVILHDNSVYDASERTSQIVIDAEVFNNSKNQKSIINAYQKQEYLHKISTRAATSWHLRWYFTEHNPEDEVNCYAYSISGVLSSKGATEYTFARVLDDFRNPNLPLVTRPMINFWEIGPYLEGEGFDIYDPESLTASMSSSQVVSTIYNDRAYIITGLTFSGTTNNHVGVITGYSSTTTSYTYQIYDPRSTSVNGKCTMDANTKIFSNPDSEAFVWDAGYVIVY